MSDNSGEIKKRKLTLNRETVTVMTADQLADVNGGHWTKYVIKGIRVVSEVFGISTAAKEGYDALKSDGNKGGGGGGPPPPKMPASRYYKTPGGCAD